MAHADPGAASARVGGVCEAAAGRTGPGVEYLARYTRRVAISNERLVGLHHGHVTLRVRDNTHAGKKRIERVPTEAFIGRFLLHVLPPRLKRYFLDISFNRLGCI
jgi:hypothetical protein